MVLAQGSYKPKTKIGRQYLLPKKKCKTKNKKYSNFKDNSFDSKYSQKWPKMHTKAVISSIALKWKNAEVSIFISYGVILIFP